MTEKIEYKGYWWLPSNPDESVAGVLTYIPNERIDLELLGNLNSQQDKWINLIDINDATVIHGISSDSKMITLIFCNPYSIKQSSNCPFPIVIFKCKFLILGKYLDNPKQECFHRAIVTIPHLSYWKFPKSLETKFGDNTKNGIECNTISFKSKSTNINNTSIDENTNLVIKEGVSYNRDPFTFKAEQNTYLEIIKNKNVSAENIHLNIEMFEEFLSFATLQTVKCTEILLYDETFVKNTVDKIEYYNPIKLIYVQNSINGLVKDNWHKYLFYYDKIELQYPYIIQKWYEDKDDITPIRSHLIDSINNKGVFSSGDFLIVIQAIEGFWWRFRDEDYKKINTISNRNKTHLSTMIKQLIEEFHVVKPISSLDLDIKSVVDSRHYYSHFMHKDDKPHSLDGIELYDITHKLRILLICCVLNFIGFNYSQINDILNNSHNSMIKPR